MGGCEKNAGIGGKGTGGALQAWPRHGSWERGHLGRHAGWKPALLTEERDATPPRVGATGRSPLREAGNHKILLPLLPFHRRGLPLGREVLNGMRPGEALRKLFPQRRHRERTVGKLSIIRIGPHRMLPVAQAVPVEQHPKAIVRIPTDPTDSIHVH